MEYEVNIIVTVFGEFVYNVEYDCHSDGYYGDNTYWNSIGWVTIKGIHVLETEVLVIEEDAVCL